MSEFQLHEWQASFGKRTVSLSGKTWGKNTARIVVPYEHIATCELREDDGEPLLSLGYAQSVLHVRPHYTVKNGPDAKDGYEVIVHGAELRDLAAEIARRMESA